MMMHQYDTAVRIADHILKHPEGLAAFDEREAHTVTAAREVYGRAVELERREVLEGNVLQQKKDELAARIKLLLQETLGNYEEYKR